MLALFPELDPVLFYPKDLRIGNFVEIKKSKIGK